MQIFMPLKWKYNLSYERNNKYYTLLLLCTVTEEEITGKIGSIFDKIQSFKIKIFRNVKLQ